MESEHTCQGEWNLKIPFIAEHCRYILQPARARARTGEGGYFSNLQFLNLLLNLDLLVVTETTRTLTCTSRFTVRGKNNFKIKKITKKHVPVVVSTRIIPSSGLTLIEPQSSDAQLQQRSI